jgi:hypothetical protein
MTDRPGPAAQLSEPVRQVAADVAVILVFAVALVVSRDFASVARWFPTAVGLVGMAAGLGKLAVDMLALRKARAAAGEPEPAPEAGPAEPAPAPEAGPAEPEPGPALAPADLSAPPLTPAGRRELLIWIGLIAVLLVLIRLIGMVPAAALWLPAVLWFRGKRSVPLAAGGAVGVVVLLVLMEAELNVRWPEPLFDIYGMLT